MKIIHIIIALNLGGAELMLKRLVTSHLDNSNYHHTVVSLCDLGPVGRQLRELGVEVVALGMHSVFQLPVVFFRLIRTIHSREPDIVQTWMYHADLVGGLAARLAGCQKVIWGVRNTDVYSNNGVSRGTAILMKLSAILSRVIPHTIVCVAYKARDVHVEKGYVINKMVVIGNGFDTEVFKFDANRRMFMRQSLNLPADALVIGSIGRYNQYKDHQSFITSAGDLASIDDGVYFLLAGANIDIKNKTMNKWIQDTGYFDRFRLVGERSDVPDILNAMDIFCLHSISEGFPNVLGEAMSIGLPSVVTEVGDAALILGVAGLVVPPRDQDALTNSLSDLMNLSSEQRVELGKLARRRIKEKFSIRSVQVQYEELYKKVVNE